MAELSVLTSLRVEAQAVGGADVVVGMGHRRARRTAATLSTRIADSAAVAMVGVAGGLAPGLNPGDLVIATEVRHDDGRAVRRFAASGILAKEFTGARGKVHAGPLISSRSFVRSEGRAALEATGAFAVDMETAWVAESLDPRRPLAVVRAISDTAQDPPLRGGFRALRSLRGVRVPLERWARACGPHEVLLASPRSFCAGVERAIEIVERALERFGAPVFVRRQIVHNLHVVRDLESKGAVFVEELDEVPDEAVVVFAAHGVSPEVREEAARRHGLNVIDATCPLVAKVHAEARRYAARDYSLVLIGHGDHEEVVGTRGEAPEHISVVEGLEDVATLDLDPARPVAYLTQTTLATDEAAVVVDALRQRFGDVEGPPADDICYATQNRQDAVRSIARRCDLMLVVGSENSSNTLRLVELADREGTRAELVEDASELELGWLDGVRTIGVTAGASVPDALVTELLETLGALGPVDLREERVAHETVRFALPGKVR